MKTYGGGNPTNAVILVRVYHVNRDNVGLKFYPNPWRLYCDGILDFRSASAYQGYFLGQAG